MMGKGGEGGGGAFPSIPSPFMGTKKSYAVSSNFCYYREPL